MVSVAVAAVLVAAVLPAVGNQGTRDNKMISKQFYHTLQARVRQAEQATDAELVTVLAPASDG